MFSIGSMHARWYIFIFSYQVVQAQQTIANTPAKRGILRLIELLNSNDVAVCKNAAFALSTSCQLDVNAITACNSKALESLVTLMKDPIKNASNFAAEAAEKLLNYRTFIYIHVRLTCKILA